MHSEPEADPSEEESDGLVGRDEVPLPYHAMPIDVVTDFVTANRVKTCRGLVADPLPLALALLERGVTYFGLCGSEKQREYQEKLLHDCIMKALKDPNNPLCDHRLVPGGRQGRNTADDVDVDETGDEDDGGGPPPSLVDGTKTKEQNPGKKNLRQRQRGRRQRDRHNQTHQRDRQNQAHREGWTWQPSWRRPAQSLLGQGCCW